MTYDYFVFRGTSDYVADIGGDQPGDAVVLFDQHPTNYPNGWTAGWKVGGTGADRSKAYGSRFAGENGSTSSSNGFRIDLKYGPGKYRLRIGAGRLSASVNTGFVVRAGGGTSATAGIAVSPQVPSTAAGAGSLLDSQGALCTPEEWSAGSHYIEFETDQDHIWLHRGSATGLNLIVVGIEYEPALNALTLPGAKIESGDHTGTRIGRLVGSASGSALLVNDPIEGLFSLDGLYLEAGGAVVFDPDAAFLFPRITETLDGSDGSPRESTIPVRVIPKYIAPASPPASVFPGESWEGNPGSGAAPTDPPRERAKPVLQPLNPDHLCFASDGLILFQSYCRWGVRRVEIHCEGRIVAETTMRKVALPPDAKGVVRHVWCYAFNLDWSEFTQDGEFDLYAVAVPNDPAFQSRVMGPYRYRRATSEFDANLTIDPDLPSSGSRFQDFFEAVSWCQANGKARPLLTYVKSGCYDWSSARRLAQAAAGHPVSFGAMNGWITVTKADGLDVKLAAPGPRPAGGIEWDPGINGLRIRDLHVDTENFSQPGWIQRHGSDTGVRAYFWIDCCYWEYSPGVYSLVDHDIGPNNVRDSNPPQDWGYLFVTDSHMDNTPDGPGACRILRHTKLTNVAGDAISRSQSVYGLVVEGYDTVGFREPLDALDVTYTGADAIATIEKDGSTNLTFKWGAETSTLVLGDLGQPLYTVAEVRDAINQMPGWSATVPAGATRWNDRRAKGGLTKQGVASNGAFAATNAKNTTVRMVTQFDMHGDLLQITGGPSENIVVVNTRATGVGTPALWHITHPDGLRDFALINTLYVADPQYSKTSQISDAAHRSHCLIWHNTVLGQSVALGEAGENLGFSDHDWSNNIFHRMGGEIFNPPINHAYTDMFGESNILLLDAPKYPVWAIKLIQGASTESLFRDAAALDYRPRADGEAVLNADYARVPFDLAEAQRNSLSALGPYELVSEATWVTIEPGSVVQLTLEQCATLQALTADAAPAISLGPVEQSWRAEPGEAGALITRHLRFEIV